MTGKKLSADEEALVLAAIRTAELSTSAEICVHVDACGAADPMEEARRIFARSGMTATRDRNAVLVYLSLANRAFAFWGDAGANAAIGESGWQTLRERMSERLVAAGPAVGIAEAVRWLGERLAAPYPRRADDVNELPDSIGGGRAGA